MTNFAAQLKAEISRIAKKEVRSETKQLKKASASYRSEIAALKRRLSELERALSKAKKGVTKPSNSVDAEPKESLRFRSSGFATLRKKLGLSAEQMGKLIGVSAQSVYHWEAGKSKPRASQMPSIAQARKIGKRGAVARLAELEPQ
jgi:DNA-binding XRE family transcriptional regulator